MAAVLTNSGLYTVVAYFVLAVDPWTKKGQVYFGVPLEGKGVW